MLIAVLSNCNSEKSNDGITNISSLASLNNLDSINSINSENLKLYHNAIDIKLDSSYYTYEFEKFVNLNKGNLFLKGNIIDILKSKNGYKIILSTTKRTFLIKSIINTDSLTLVKLRGQSKHKINSGYFIIKVNSITTLFPTLEAEIASDDEAELSFDISNKVVKLNGDLIDFYINKK